MPETPRRLPEPLIGLKPQPSSRTRRTVRPTEVSSTRTALAPALSDEEQLVLYRVTQESLSNVVQHSGASP